MDQLDGFFQQLVRAIASRDAALLHRPFPLTDIPARLLPYPAARRALGIDSHQDYEMVILRLAAGERGYLQTTPEEAAAQLAAEAATPNPETAFFRRFPEAHVRILPEAARRVLAEAPRFAPPAEPASSPPAEHERASAPPTAAPADSCPRCGSNVGTGWQFCAHCGESLTPSVRRYRVAAIAGDGIGPEVIEAAIPVLDAAAACHGFACAWERLPYSADHYLATGETLPEPAFRSLRDGYDAIFLGALGDPRVPGDEHARDILLGLRSRLDLYVNFRPVRLFHPDLTPLRPARLGGGTIDIAIFRENTEGAYLGRGRVEGDAHVAEEVHTAHGVERILRAAFEWAEVRSRTRVTMADKSNAIPAHRVWLEGFRRIAAEFPGIAAEHRYVDALALELVREPTRFEVIVTGNLFGDILTDLAAGLVGGLGLAASANLHPGRPGLFEPVHGSAPPLAGRGVANPLGAILSGGLMFGALGEDDAARAVEEAVARALRDGLRTRDLGGRHTTAEAARAVVDCLA